MPREHRHRQSPPTVVVAVALCLAVALSACGGGGSSSDSGGTASTLASPDALSVDIRGFAFQPAELTVEAGATVSWENFDSFAHSIVIEGDAFADSGRLEEGDRFDTTFAAPGRYPYICGIHNSMKGTVVVV